MKIILFGATGGIGSCLAHELSKNNDLYLSSRSNQKLEALIGNIKKFSDTSSNKKLGGSIIKNTNFNEIEKFINQGNNFLGSVDCIINCIGSLLIKPAHLTTEEELIDVFNTNVFSCFSILKHSFKFLKRNGGNIIFFSSAAANIGLKNHEAISSAKGAISAMALSAASTYANYNIRINTIAPGLVDTPLTKKIVSNNMSYNYSKNLHGLNRIGYPENFIPFINSLIDTRSNWITGQTFTIDGGLSTVK